MKRIRLVLLCTAAVLALVGATYLVAANNQHEKKAHATSLSTDSGPLANATVSFGAWMTSPPVDRFLRDTLDPLHSIP